MVSPKNDVGDRQSAIEMQKKDPGAEAAPESLAPPSNEAGDLPDAERVRHDDRDGRGDLRCSADAFFQHGDFSSFWCRPYCLNAERILAIGPR